jgi:hypothetical protein
MNKRLFCSRRPLGGVGVAVAIALTLRTAKRLQKKCLQRTGAVS